MQHERKHHAASVLKPTTDWLENLTVLAPGKWVRYMMVSTFVLKVAAAFNLQLVE